MPHEDNNDDDFEGNIEAFVAKALADLGIETASDAGPIVTREQLKQITFVMIRRLAHPQFYAEDLHELITNYEDTLSQIHEAFGYNPFADDDEPRVIPLDDQRHCWWFMRDDVVVFGDDDCPYDAEKIVGGHCYISRRGALAKWIYENATHTMLCVDAGGQKLLQIFTNENRKPAVDGSGRVIN